VGLADNESMRVGELRVVIFDLDGVIYRGDQVLPGAADTVTWLGEHGYQVHFLTNNSGTTRQDYVKKLTGLGVSCEIGQVMTSAYATGLYFQEQGLLPARVLVIGHEGLRSELREAGITVVLADEPGEVGYVIVGMDREFTYQMLLRAQQAILGGARFIACNRDPTYPVENGVLPGSGALVSAVATASLTEPFVIGKPRTYMLEKILAKAQAQPSEALIVGDRLDTDVAVGHRAGLRTVLVLTGVTSREEAESAPGEQQPDWVIGDLREFTALLEDSSAGVNHA